MRKILAVCWMAFSLPASASSLPKTNTAVRYDMKMQLSVGGQTSAPRIIVTEGQRASIEEARTAQIGHLADRIFVEVVATESKTESNGIMMDFVVGTINRDGIRTIVSKPRILATENQRAEISVSSADGKGAMSLAVVAHRSTF